MRASLAVVLPLVLAACGGGSSTSAPQVFTEYTLQSINGSPPPGVVDKSTDGTFTSVVTDITLRVDGTSNWQAYLNGYKILNGIKRTVSTASYGSYVISGSAATFTDVQGGVDYSGTLINDTYTLTGSLQNTFVFVRK